jgi:hypothetical protein
VRDCDNSALSREPFVEGATNACSSKINSSEPIHFGARP